MFWGINFTDMPITREWERGVLGNEGTETPASLICLAPTVHALWGKARFALKLPLPSVDLLQMQWVLNRLTALSGAADVSDEELDPDSSRSGSSDLRRSGNRDRPVGRGGRGRRRRMTKGTRWGRNLRRCLGLRVWFLGLVRTARCLKQTNSDAMILPRATPSPCALGTLMYTEVQ
ncbi:hypothetical protein BDW59DRAFT_141993 [Aspergillus cavernicola]|uniref:Uncharacterized protein n=1 Tax=Aspergillus cavernicola TaxID=176166 RepID=A0ABR4IQ08_9EURO